MSVPIISSGTGLQSFFCITALTSMSCMESMPSAARLSFSPTASAFSPMRFSTASTRSCKEGTSSGNASPHEKSSYKNNCTMVLEAGQDIQSMLTVVTLTESLPSQYSQCSELRWSK